MNNTSILIVEDDAEMRETLCDILVAEGYRVKTAGTGKSALAIAKKETYPICLVDLKLPDITGLEVVKGLKSINVDTAPIIVTAFASKETAIEALKAGAFCYIEKPMNLEELLSTVKRTSDAYQLLEAKRRVETALQKNEERYRTLVESTEDSVYLVDKNCRYLFMNEKHISRLRLSSDHYLGQPYRAFHLDDDAKRFAEKVKHVFKTGASVQHEYENNDGQYFIKTLSPVKTHETGRVVAVTVVSKDITGRKRAEERIEHLNSVHKAIMNVDQLILVEKDRDRLLQKAFNALIDARNYDAAWIGLLKDGERFTTLKGSCLMDDVARFCKHLKAGDFPPCIKNALAQKDPLIVQDKTIDNEDCIFKHSCAGTKTVLIRAEHANRLFGLLAISVTAGVTV
ncbi:DNA-binding transcriptional response regulator, partial [Candidatus Methanophagaceae archaeon]